MGQKFAKILSLQSKQGEGSSIQLYVICCKTSCLRNKVMCSPGNKYQPSRSVLLLQNISNNEMVRTFKKLLQCPNVNHTLKHLTFVIESVIIVLFPFLATLNRLVTIEPFRCLQKKYK